MTGVPMTVPKNVLWFEILLYMSLMLDALSVAFSDRTPNPQMTESIITEAATFSAARLLPPTPSAGASPGKSTATRNCGS